MLSDKKADVLQAYLGGLPPDLAARLAKAVEADRLADGATLPHGLILDGLRPALLQAPRNRTPTPLRLFCSPFEDILTSAPRKQKHSGVIARTSIMPVWEWLNQTLIPAETREYIAEIKSLLVALRLDDAKARAGKYWSVASVAMLDAQASKRGRSRAEEGLRNAGVLADAREMALLLGIGTELCLLQDLIPKPLPELTQENAKAAHAAYKRLVGVSPDAAPYVVVVVMNRLSRRWEVLRLAVQISGKTCDTLISQTDIGLAGDLLFAELAALSAAVRDARHPRFDAEMLIRNVASFAELSGGIVKELEIRRDGRWGQSLLKERAEIGEVMDKFMARAPAEIEAALPMKRSKRPMDEETLARARRYAMLVAGCRPFATAASFAASRKDAEEKAVNYLRIFNDDALWGLRSAEGDALQLLERQFALAVELMTLLCGEQDADILRRRARAARSAAA